MSLEGAVTVEPEGSSPVTLRQGETFHQPPVVPHSAKNASASEPARVLVFMVVEQGKPLAEPVQ
jgi:quercetin dioxygenase-like cupin family protein